EQLVHFGRSLGGSAVVHSLYFEILSELGSVGVVLFIAILYQHIKDMTFITNTSKEYSRYLQNEESHILPEDKENFLQYLTWAQYYRLAITGGFIGCLVPAAFLSMFYYSHFWVLSSMLMALKDITIVHIQTIEQQKDLLEHKAP